ncbi:MAG: class I SAM-dependent methyltransferase [Acidobacteriota bacterium]|nr:class I SAM-dependent methyltransferase [Acidobacteriota bacterium]
MSCLLCRSAGTAELFRGTDRLYRTTARSFPVVRCTQCGLVRMHPAPQGAELASYYPRHYWFQPERNTAGAFEEAYRRLLVRDHVRFVHRALRNSRETGPVLDVGCGGGLLLGMLRLRNVPVLGLDSSEEAASVAWHHNRVPAFRGDLAHAPLAPASCAVITMFHVVEHLPDPHSYIGAARSLLKPNGRLVIQVPNIACWQFKLLGAGWNGIDVPRHLYDFRPQDLTRLLHDCGFEITRTRQFSWRDNPAGLATSLAPTLEPVARRVRSLDRSGISSLIKDAAYLALVLAAVPFTLLEAAFGHGSTVMIEARKTA